MYGQRAPSGKGHHLSTQHPRETQEMLGDPGIIMSMDLKFHYPCLEFTQINEDMLNTCLTSDHLPFPFPMR